MDSLLPQDSLNQVLHGKGLAAENPDGFGSQNLLQLQNSQKPSSLLLDLPNQKRTFSDVFSEPQHDNWGSESCSDLLALDLSLVQEIQAENTNSNFDHFYLDGLLFDDGESNSKVSLVYPSNQLSTTIPIKPNNDKPISIEKAPLEFTDQLRSILLVAAKPTPTLAQSEDSDEAENKTIKWRRKMKSKPSPVNTVPLHSPDQTGIVDVLNMALKTIPNQTKISRSSAPEPNLTPEELRALRMNPHNRRKIPDFLSIVPLQYPLEVYQHPTSENHWIFCHSLPKGARATQDHKVLEQLGMKEKRTCSSNRDGQVYFLLDKTGLSELIEQKCVSLINMVLLYHFFQQNF